MTMGIIMKGANALYFKNFVDFFTDGQDQRPTSTVLERLR